MKLGDANVNKIRLGSTQMKRVYLGSDIVWQNAPTAIAATGVGTTSFTAEWEAYSGATYYLLDVSESSDFSTFVYKNQIVEAPTTSYVVIGLNSNTTYYYRVRAGDGALPFQFSVKTDNAGVSTSTQFRMPLTTSTGLNFDVDWGDGSPTENITNHTLAIHTYPSAGTYTITVTGSILGWQFKNGGDKLKMLNVNSWGALNISVDQGFNGCTNLTCSATDAPLITSTSLNNYFFNCTNFNGDVNNWVFPPTLTTIAAMFRGAATFNRDLNAWDTSNIQNMANVFQYCSTFNGDINSWNTSNVTRMENMFSFAYVFNQDISQKTINVGQPNEYVAWDVSNVTNMLGMFNLARLFNQPIGNWNISSLLNINDMFRSGFGSGNTMAFDQDISNWDITSLTSATLFRYPGGFFSNSNYNALLIGWEATLQAAFPSGVGYTPLININFGSGSKFTLGSAAEAARLSLINNFNWTLSDGGGIL